MEKQIIPHTIPIQQALEILEENSIKTLFLADENGMLHGSLTDGDIRRWILKTGDIKGIVSQACNKEPFILYPPVDKPSALKAMQEKHLFAAPVLNQKGSIEAIISLDDLTAEQLPEATSALANIPVVIMAGGKGTRLDPFTRILPKPLIPIGNQPVIEVIMQEFASFGASHFYISLNHKARLIKAYFEDQQYPYGISFLEEDIPLGTAGALKLLEGKVSGNLVVSNCDIIIKTDYNEMLRFHTEGGYAMTIVAAVHNHSIPYGVCDLDEKGELKQITEKPQYSLLINSGMYVLDTSILSLIPGNSLFHITHLIEALQHSGKPVGVYPIPESAYHDIGQWDAYHNALPQLT